MTNLVATELTAAADQIQAATQTVLDAATPEAFEQLEQRINRLGVFLRESLQAELSPLVKAALRALERGDAVPPDQLDAIRALVVGDAAEYLAAENNFDEWVAELQRLATEIARLASSADSAALRRLRGTIQDASRLLPAMRSYAADKQRIAQFDRAFGSLDDGNRRVLIDVLREMLASSTR